MPFACSGIFIQKKYKFFICDILIFTYADHGIVILTSTTKALLKITSTLSILYIVSVNCSWFANQLIVCFWQMHHLWVINLGVQSVGCSFCWAMLALPYHYLLCLQIHSLNLFRQAGYSWPRDYGLFNTRHQILIPVTFLRTGCKFSAAAIVHSGKCDITPCVVIDLMTYKFLRRYFKSMLDVTY